jgi:hypothetical protein
MDIILKCDFAKDRMFFKWILILVCYKTKRLTLNLNIVKTFVQEIKKSQNKIHSSDINQM